MENDKLTTTFVNIRQRLTSMARRILGDEDEAADAVQDAFCRLWQRRESITTSSAAEGLSVVTVRNICIDSIRHKTVLDTVPVDGQKEVADMVTSDDGDVGRTEMFEEVNKIIASRLSDTQKTIMRMREYEGASFDDIAQELGMTEPNVRVNLSRARKLIRDIYNNNHKQ